MSGQHLHITAPTGATVEDRIRAFRKENALSQRALSAALGFSNSYVSQIEAGNLEFSGGFLRRMGEVYGVSADWLLFGKATSACGQPSPDFARPETRQIEMTAPHLHITAAELIGLIRRVTQDGQSARQRAHDAVTETAMEYHADQYQLHVTRLAELVALAEREGLLATLETALINAASEVSGSALPVVETAEVA